VNPISSKFVIKMFYDVVPGAMDLLSRLK